MYDKYINLYQEKKHQTDDKKKILLLLYEKIVLLLGESIDQMADYKNYGKINNNLKKVTEILEELQKSIDLKQGEISQNLYQLYAFLIEQTVEANIQKKSDKLENAKKIVEDLLTAWRKATLTSSDFSSTIQNNTKKNIKNNGEELKISI